MTFHEVIGQKEVRERLLQMHRENRLPHAIMLCGPEGVGKKALATAFACCLLDNTKRSEKTEGTEEWVEHPMLKKL